MTTDETNPSRETIENTVKIGVLIQSNAEIKEILTESSKQQLETNKVLNLLLQSNVRTEERQAADREWQKRVEAHQDKQDENIEKAREEANDAKDIANEAKGQSLRNGMWINLGVAILTGILIFIGKEIIGKVI